MKEAGGRSERGVGEGVGSGERGVGGQGAHLAGKQQQGALESCMQPPQAAGQGLRHRRSPPQPTLPPCYTQRAAHTRAAVMSLVARPSLRWVRDTASEVMWPCTSSGVVASSSLHACVQECMRA